MASSDQAVTLQIAALSAVHNEYADCEKKELKRKLAECQKDLKEARLRIKQRRCEVNAVCKESRESMHKVDLVLRQGVYDGLPLSKEQVNDLSNHLHDAHNVLNEIKDPGSSCYGSDSEDSGSESEDNDEGEE